MESQSINWEIAPTPICMAAVGEVGGRGPEAELAIRAAMRFMDDQEDQAELILKELEKRMDNLPGLNRDSFEEHLLVERIQSALKKTLPSHDEFWAQWSLEYRRRPKMQGGASV